MSKLTVVTGGAGFIGSHIATALLANGYQVRVVDNLSTGSKENLADIADQIEFFQADVCDERRLAEIFDGAEIVYHQAALASVPLSLERPMDVNQACVTGTLAVLNQALRAKVRRVVYAGSSSCYGDQPFAANRETDLLLPMSPYAAAKLAGEHYCQAFYRSHGLETVVLRYFNVFGPRQNPDSPYSAVIPLFITRLLSGRQPIVYGDGNQSRDFAYVDNVVQGNLLAASVQRAAGKTFNLASGRSTTLIQLLDRLGELLQVDVQPEFQPPRAGDVRDSLADISTAAATLGYQPSISLEQGLERSIDYYRSQAAATLDSSRPRSAAPP